MLLLALCLTTVHHCHHQVLASLESLYMSIPKIKRSKSEPAIHRTDSFDFDFKYMCASPKTPINRPPPPLRPCHRQRKQPVSLTGRMGFMVLESGRLFKQLKRTPSIAPSIEME